MSRTPLLFVILALLVAGRLGADERLKGIACRSVHLQFPAPEGLAFYNEVTVDESSPGTYFCVCGFNKGYYGIQQLANDKKVIIFSVWDPGKQNDPNAVKAEDRVKLLYHDPAVRIGRFGNEGTGGQSFLDLDWQIGQTYRFLVTAKIDGQRTAYTAHFFDPKEKQWRRLVTFSTLSGGKPLGGYYAFVEDFRRNRVSATKERSARFGGGWVKTTEGQWVALTQAKFTADSNPVTNINAGVRGDKFFLATGGATRNDGTPLGRRMNRPPAGLDLPDE